jgi:DNA-binding NarL/FixJ family response regulator
MRLVLCLRLQIAFKSLRGKEIIAAGAHGFVPKGKESHDLLRVVRDVLKRDIQAASGTSIQ